MLIKCTQLLQLQICTTPDYNYTTLHHTTRHHTTLHYATTVATTTNRLELQREREREREREGGREGETQSLSHVSTHQWVCSAIRASTAHLSYRFPVLETPATCAVLLDTTGILKIAATLSFARFKNHAAHMTSPPPSPSSSSSSAAAASSARTAAHGRG